MPSRQTGDGFTLPVTVAGHPALELCNTRAGWSEARPKEYLVDFAHTVALARELGLIDVGTAAHVFDQAAAHRDGANREHRSMLRLRDDLYEVLTKPARVPTARRIDVAMRAAAAQRKFTGRDADGIPRWADAPLTLATVRHQFSFVIHDLLSSSAGRYVRACPGPRCGWLFTDSSGRRRWCSMQWCGNRNKAQRHATQARRQSHDASHSDPTPDAVRSEVDSGPAGVSSLPAD